MNKKIVSMLVALFMALSALSAVSGDGSDPLDPSDGGADWDGDGLTNAEEQNHGTNMNNADSDGDGLPDGWEVNNGLSPTNGGDANGDPDGDGILGTSPLNNNNAGVINDQGLVVSHFEAGGYDTNPAQNSVGNYLFQTPGSPVSITAQPSSASGCEGSTVEFEVVASSQTEITYQWFLMLIKMIGKI